MAKKQTKVVHAIPRGDFRTHKTTMECWCNPYTRQGKSHVVIHNAIDGREMYEFGQRTKSWILL